MLDGRASCAMNIDYSLTKQRKYRDVSLRFNNQNAIHDVTENENKVKRYLKQAYQTACQILKQERRLLLEVADYLSKNPSIDTKTFEDFLARFITPEGLELFHKRKMPYRAHLHKMVAEARDTPALPDKKLLLLKELIPSGGSSLHSKCEVQLQYPVEKPDTGNNVRT